MWNINESLEAPPKKSKIKWKPLFHPKSYWKELGFKDLSSHILNTRKLRAHAKDVVRARALFVDKAKALVEDANENLQQALEVGLPASGSRAQVGQ